MVESSVAGGAAAAGSLEAAGASSSIRWFYEDRGSERGPVSTEEMLDLIHAGAAQHRTLVWRRGLARWTPLMESELARHLEGPPPIATTTPGRAWVWALATSPLVAVALQGVAAGMWAAGTDQAQRLYAGDPTLVYQMWPVGIAYITLLAFADWAYLGKGKHTRPWILWLPLTPAYLWARAAKLDQRQVPFAAWCIAFLASVFLGGSPHLP